MDDAYSQIFASVQILTRNSEATLGRALESVKEFAEVIVCDGDSNDRTTSIAESFGCLILRQSSDFLSPDGSLRDYAGVRNQMIDASSHDWIFQLDSDEVATPQLVEQIRRISRDPYALPGYMVAARYTVRDRSVDCASTYPMYFLRLFRVSSSSPYVGAINENVEVQGCLGRIEEPFLIPLPRLRPLAGKWLRYVSIYHREAMDAAPSARTRHIRHCRSAIRWFVRDVRAAHMGCQGYRLPVRYEALRFVFRVATYLAVRFGDARARWRGMRTREGTVEA